MLIIANFWLLSKFFLWTLITKLDDPSFNSTTYVLELQYSEYRNQYHGLTQHVRWQQTLQPTNMTALYLFYQLGQPPNPYYKYFFYSHSSATWFWAYDQDYNQFWRHSWFYLQYFNFLYMLLYFNQVDNIGRIFQTFAKFCLFDYMEWQLGQMRLRKDVQNTAISNRVC